MKITFDYNQDNAIKDKNMENAATKGASKMRGGYRTQMHGDAKGAGVSGILFGSGRDDRAYGKAGKTGQDIKNETGLLSGEDYKNYMIVMSSSMSGEDFSALIEEGVKPGKVEVGDMVTIMDHIKAVMAQSGVVISGFNGSGDIPMDKLEAMAGDAAYAQSIVQAFSENDIPLTEENVENAIKQTNLALEITGLSDNMKQYLMENSAEFSIDQIYKAQFSAEKKAGSQRALQRNGGSYFADDLNGYFGKTPEKADYKALEEQIDKVIKEAGLSVNEETKAEAAWILEKGMLLTGENIEKLHEINQMHFPMEREEILSHVAQAIGEGKQPREADLSKEGIYKQAEKLLETVSQITDEAVEAVISSGEKFNIRNLDRAQREIQLALDNSKQQATTRQQIAQEQAGITEETLVHAKRTLEEVRLQMTLSANIMLLKSDYAIDTEELSQLVEDLRQIEEKQGKTYGLSLPDESKNALFQETMDKTAAIRQMPVAVLGGVIRDSRDFTLNQVYEQGKIWEADYKKAGETYEALMTVPRADLGDRLKDAFSNIDEILSDLDMELSEDNRRAVRILAYNQMDITEDNLLKVREADAALHQLLEKMTPSATLQMIREDINPLEESVQALMEYFNGQEGDLTGQTEAFSKFLYKLEKDNQISPEERDSYIGIYRLIRQIEKGDGKAIGTIVKSGQELSFANLLSAVRTSQKKGVNAVIDDNFGLLSDTEVKGKRISDQINRYYETKASELLTRLDPQLMAQNQVTMNTTWEELIQVSEQVTEQTRSRIELEQAYREEQMRQLRDNVGTEGEVAEYLLSNGQPVTPDNLHGANKLLKNRGEMFRQIHSILSGKQKTMSEMSAGETENIAEVFDQITEKFTDAASAQNTYEEVQSIVSERLEESMLSGEMGYLDIRALSSISKQLSLAGSLAKEENYEIPAVIDGQLTSVNVHFRHDSSQAESVDGNVTIQISLTGGERIFADFKMRGDSIRGYMGCNDKSLLEKMQVKKEDFTQKILSETGKMADINFVYSEEIKISSPETSYHAGKRIQIGAETGNKETENRENKQTGQTEEVQGRHTSAKELYLAAKAFIGLLKEIPQ